MKACPSCGGQLWPEDRFCGWCGHALQSAPAPSSASTPAPPDPPRPSGSDSAPRGDIATLIAGPAHALSPSLLVETLRELAWKAAIEFDMIGNAEIYPGLERCKRELSADDWAVVHKALRPRHMISCMGGEEWDVHVTYGGGVAIRNHHRVIAINLEQAAILEDFDRDALRREIDTVLQRAAARGTPYTTFLHHGADGVRHHTSCPHDFGLSGQTILMVESTELVNGLPTLSQPGLLAQQPNSRSGHVVYRFFPTLIAAHGTYRHNDEADIILEEYSHHLPSPAVAALNEGSRPSIPSSELTTGWQTVHAPYQERFNEEWEATLAHYVPPILREDILAAAHRHYVGTLSRLGQDFPSVFTGDRTKAADYAGDVAASFADRVDAYWTHRHHNGRPCAFVTPWLYGIDSLSTLAHLPVEVAALVEDAGLSDATVRGFVVEMLPGGHRLRFLGEDELFDHVMDYEDEVENQIDEDEDFELGEWLEDKFMVGVCIDVDRLEEAHRIVQDIVGMLRTGAQLKVPMLGLTQGYEPGAFDTGNAPGFGLQL